MKKSLFALSILLSTSVMADYKVIMSGQSGKIKLPEQPATTTNFVSHTFTNCGQTGRFGPSQSNCISDYNGSDILDPELSFSVSNGIQSFIIPESGSYRITAFGAEGGGSRSGKGAKIEGSFTLNQGQIINILVGQKGDAKTIERADFSGGGGTFLTADGSLLLVAGGGAGSNSYSAQGHHGQAIMGGSSNGGASDNLSVDSGAGYSGNGTSGWNGSLPANSFLNGGIGGRNSYGDLVYNAPGSFAPGGFGGGGSSNRFHSSFSASGGGGGYSGGDSGYRNDNSGVFSYGKGGTSYNIGETQSNLSGVNNGHGYLEIELIP